MGVDFFPCDSCSETVCDAGSYFPCDCGAVYHSECGERQEDEKTGDTSCQICRGEVVTEEQLLKYLIKESGITRAAHEKAIMASRKKK